MPILTFILAVALVGLLLWAIERYVPMDAGVKRFLSIAVIVLLIVWFISMVFPGLFGNMGSLRVGHQ